MDTQILFYDEIANHKIYVWPSFMGHGDLKLVSKSLTKP